MKRTNLLRSKKPMKRSPLNPTGKRTALWRSLRGPLEAMFRSEGLLDVCEARIQPVAPVPVCNGTGWCFAHGRKRNKDYHIGPLTTFVIRVCRECGYYLDAKLTPTEMFDFVWTRITERGWMPWYSWGTSEIRIIHSPLAYPVGVYWSENRQRYELAFNTQDLRWSHVRGGG